LRKLISDKPLEEDADDYEVEPEKDDDDDDLEDEEDEEEEGMSRMLA
jgi:hypothetical protein